MTTALVITLAIAVTGLAVMYLLLRRSIRQQTALLRSELQRGIEAPHEMGLNHEPIGVASVSAKASASVAPFDNFTAHEAEELRPETLEDLDRETLSAIGVSVSNLLGKSVRVSPVAAASASGVRNAWAREGCLAIQQSHELPPARSVHGASTSVRRADAKAAANRSAA